MLPIKSHGRHPAERGPREGESAFKKHEIMAFAATWVDLEIIMLSEVRQ